MSLHLIIGPMKSGKSLELIAQVAPYKFSDVSVGMYQSDRNVRDEHIASRNGTTAKAQKVRKLTEIVDAPQVIGIDEVHMFEVEDMAVVEQWLLDGKSVYVTGLDLDYSGKLIPVMRRLHELKPDSITLKQAVCDKCRKYQASFTQILKNGQPVTSGLPSVVPDDGSYQYEARCRACFVTKN